MKRILHQSIVLLLSLSAVKPMLGKQMKIYSQLATSIERLYDLFEKSGKTDQLNEDFMTVYNGMKQDIREHSEDIYNSALDNAIAISQPANIHKIIGSRNISPEKHKRAKATANYLSSIKKSKQKKVGTCCGKKTPITKNMLPLVIDQPGQYYLCDDITVAPTAEQAFALAIDADNVSIDLCGHELVQAPAELGITGITIIAGHNNISVTNGTIRGFRNAILGFIPAAGPGEEQLTLHTLCFTDLNLGGNGADDDSFAEGVSLLLGDIYELDPFPVLASKFYVHDVTIRRVKANDTFGTSAFEFFGVDNLVMEDVQANNNTLSNFGGYPSGYAIYYSRNITMNQCQGNGATHNAPDSLFTQTLGIYAADSINIIIKNSQFNDSFGEADLIVGGANLSNNQNALYENVQFNNATGGAGTDFGALIVNGIHQSGGTGQTYSANGIKYINCQFNGNHRQGLTPGIRPDLPRVTGTLCILTNNLIFENCESSHNVCENPDYPVYGFNVFSLASQPATDPFGDVNNIIFRKCLVSDNVGANLVAGFKSGVEVREVQELSSRTFNVIYDNVVAEHLRSTSQTLPCAGIAHLPYPNSDRDIFVMQNIFVNDSRFSDILGGNPDTSAAITISATLYPVVCNNSISDCMNGVVLTGSNQFGYCLNGHVKDNTVTNCIFTGYRDDSSSNNNSFVGNYAQNNAQANYTGVPNGNIVPFNSNTGVFTGTPNRWSNISAD